MLTAYVAPQLNAAGKTFEATFGWTYSAGVLAGAGKEPASRLHLTSICTDRRLHICRLCATLFRRRVQTDFRYGDKLRFLSHSSGWNDYHSLHCYYVSG
jgi:hypothetical protein